MRCDIFYPSSFFFSHIPPPLWRLIDVDVRGFEMSSRKKTRSVTGKEFSFCQEHCLFRSPALISQTLRSSPASRRPPGAYAEPVTATPPPPTPPQPCVCTAFCRASAFVVLWTSEIIHVVVYRQLGVRGPCAGMCAPLFFRFFSTYPLCFVLTAGSVSHVERGDGEDRHSTHQGQRKPHQGPGNRGEYTPACVITL